MWRLRVCLLPAAMCLRAREECRVACMVGMGNGSTDTEGSVDSKEDSERKGK
jgi:hypothetical protein